VPILRGNHAQRVIALPVPGPHEVRMHYRPPGFTAGLAITALTACLWVAACVVQRGYARGWRPRPLDSKTHARRHGLRARALA
jgi:hypothetical protein